MSLSGPAHRAGPDLPSRPMSTFPLGGRRVRRSGYGAMHLAGPWAVNPPADRESAIGVLRAAVAAGVDHIDTAQYYGPDVVNDLIREALYPYPAELAIVSKVGVFRDAGRRCTPAAPGHRRQSAQPADRPAGRGQPPPAQSRPRRRAFR